MDESSITAPSPGILAHVLVPVANEADARRTARALEPYQPEHVTALHVVEKRPNYPDKTPVEQSKDVGARAVATVREVFPDADEQIAYSADIAEAIFDAAEAIDASAVVYRSRGGGRILQFLTGDLSLTLVTKASRPVIALPRTDTDRRPDD